MPHTNPPNPAPKLSSSDALARDIVRGLYEGRYAAGQRLVEPDLMAKYSVSRSTVREAIKKLTAQGIAESHLNRGARIRQLTRTEAENILLILEQLIGLAARQAAQKINAPGNREIFNQVLSPLLQANDAVDKFEFSRLRNKFNRTLARIGGNEELETLLSNVNAHVFGHRMEVSPDHRRQSYRKIGTAVLSGDAATAEAEARAYVRRSIVLLNTLFPED